MQFLFAALAFVWLVGCTRDLEIGTDLLERPGRDSEPQDAGLDAADSTCEVTRCDGKIYACGDCLDNDVDGTIDSADPECLGACDATENSYFSGILGQSDATCKLDCYFDGDNGSGNDDCHWSQRCDPLSEAPDYPPSGESQCAYDAGASTPGTALGCELLASSQSAQCLAACLPLTPKGCDCFGCCEIPLTSGHFVWLGSTLDGVGSCDANALDDPLRCRPCTRTSGCARE